MASKSILSLNIRSYNLYEVLTIENLTQRYQTLLRLPLDAIQENNLFYELALQVLELITCPLKPFKLVTEKDLNCGYEDFYLQIIDEITDPKLKDDLLLLLIKRYNTFSFAYPHLNFFTRKHHLINKLVNPKIRQQEQNALLRKTLQKKLLSLFNRVVPKYNEIIHDYLFDSRRIRHIFSQIRTLEVLSNIQDDKKAILEIQKSMIHLFTLENALNKIEPTLRHRSIIYEEWINSDICFA